ncbi:hypothetical protein TrST_g5361 [Triparma strigata]|uniref:Transmembrane protein n=1 Tax=Triparma strigata TaxID=1606541 RepID=A0A9W7B547_9STRA|nr:hypothetical protein TrST_g5361 [Triparma strigata]
MSSLVVDADESVAAARPRPKIKQKPTFERAANLAQKKRYEQAASHIRNGTTPLHAPKKKLGSRTWFPASIIALAFSVLLTYVNCNGALKLSLTPDSDERFHICSFYPPESLGTSGSFEKLLATLGEEAVSAWRGSLRRVMVMDLFVVAVYNRGLEGFSQMTRGAAVWAGVLRAFESVCWFVILDNPKCAILDQLEVRTLAIWFGKLKFGLVAASFAFWMLQFSMDPVAKRKAMARDVRKQNLKEKTK